MSITKQQILAGDQDRFLTVLYTRHVSPEEAAGADLSETVELADLAGQMQGASLTLWPEDGWPSLLEKVQTIKPELALSERAYLQFCHDVLAPFTRYSQLDGELVPLLEKLQTRIFYQAMTGPVFWLKPHPVKALADILQQCMLGWQPDFGQHSNRLKECFSEAVSALDALAVDDTKGQQALFSGMKQKLGAELKTFEKFAHRLCDSESGKMKNKAAQLAVLRLVNQCFSGHRLPAEVAEFLRTTIFAELHALVAQKGLDSAIWLRARKLIMAVVEAYQLESVQGEDASQRLHQLPGQLQEFLYQYLPRSDDMDAFINTVAFDLSQLAGGKADMTLEEQPLLEIPDHLHDVERQVSSQLLKQSKKYREGQWFVLRDDNGGLKRCRLLLRLPEYNRLLLGNMVGQKTLVSSYDDFAYLLSARHIQPLSQHGSLTRCLHYQLDALLQGFDDFYHQHQQAVAAILKAHEEKRLVQEKEAAAAKARAEAEAIAKRRAEAQKQAEMEQLADDMQRQSRLMLDSLSLGSWVEMEATDGMSKRVKLAVKFAATGRFVFVDHDGITVADSSRDELVDMLLNGKMKLLDSDKRFADRLAKMVGTIRSAQG